MSSTDTVPTLPPLFAAKSDAERRLAHWMCGEIVIIEGLVGSGKSTLTTRLTRYARERLQLNADGLQEDMRAPLLDYFFKSGRAAAVTTQMVMLCKRVMVMRQATELVHMPGRLGVGRVVFMDRSLAGDRAFCACTCSPAQ